MGAGADNPRIGYVDWTAVKEVLTSLFAKIGRDNVPRLASSFSFFAILSLAPLLVLAVSGAALIWGGQTQAIHHLLEQTYATAGPQVGDFVKGVIESSQQKTEGIVATVLSLSVTFYSATNLVLQLDDAVNTIWGIKTEGPFVRTFIKVRVLAFLSVILFGAVMLAWMVLDSVLGRLARETFGFGVWRWYSFLLSLVLLSLAFSVTIRALPRGRLTWRDAWLGGFLTGLGISVSKFLLTLYFSRISGVYGIAAGAVILLLWMYYSSIIYFFGIEVTYLYAHRFGSLKSASDPLPSLDTKKQGLRAS